MMMINSLKVVAVVAAATCVGLSSGANLRSHDTNTEPGARSSGLNGKIPVFVVNAQRGWTPVSYMEVGGSQDHIPLIIDTGSSLAAICPGNNIGNAAETTMYGCGAYNTGYDGWNGTFYTADVEFGNGYETVTDPSSFEFALIADENIDLCNSDIQGILGVDFGANYVYRTPRPCPSPDTYGCGASSDSQSPSFATTMLQPSDEYTMAFVGLNPENKGESFIAFGSAATTALSESSEAGTIGLNTSTSPVYDQAWFVPDANTYVFSVSSDPASAVTYSNQPDQMPVIVDSGTQLLYLPKAFEQAYLAIPRGSNATIDIEFANIKLQVPFSLLESTSAVYFTDSVILGLPTFWVYGIMFNKQKSTIQFFNRQ